MQRGLTVETAGKGKADALAHPGRRKLANAREIQFRMQLDATAYDRIRVRAVVLRNCRFV